jgi:hypothetical protein
MVPSPLPRCASQVLRRGAQADAHGAAKVLDRCVQAVARGAARCASQVLDCGAQAAARGAARCLSQIHDFCAQAAAHGAATLLQQEYNKSARLAVEQSKYYRLCMHSGKVTLAAIYLRSVRVVGRSFAAALTNLTTVVMPPAPAARNLGVGLRRPCRG